jgi:hypothetical protein
LVPTALLTGTLTDPTDGGINFGDDTRTSWRKSDTTDLSWNLRWRRDNWTVTTDLQHIKANTRSVDSTVATGVTMPSETLDLRGNVPKILFTDADRAYLADPKNYYWAFTMEHLDQSKANETAWKTDVKYDFDNPVLRDVRFGVRLTDRDAVTQNSNPNYNWAAITQPWQVGWDISTWLIWATRASAATPACTRSITSSTAAFPCRPWCSRTSRWRKASRTPTRAAQVLRHPVQGAESGRHLRSVDRCQLRRQLRRHQRPVGKNQGLYGQLRFGWDNLKYPIDGNIGLRYVKTDSSARGYTVFTRPRRPAVLRGVPVPNIKPFAEAKNYENDYHNFRLA